MTTRSAGARLRGVRRILRALTIWHPYGRTYINPRWWRQLLSATRIRSASTRGLNPQKAISLVFTCDLELDPPWQTGSSWEHRELRGIEEGLPRLLDLLDAQKIRGTFFTEGILARLVPDAILEVVRRGHEVGGHGLAHESYGGTYRIDETIPPPPILQGRMAKESALRKVKGMLEELTGVPVLSFRAPFLHIDSESAAALTRAGFLIDSSLRNELFGRLSAPTHLDPGRPLARLADDKPPYSPIEIPVSVDLKPRLRSHHPYRPVYHGPQPRSVVNRIMAVGAHAGVDPTLVLLVHPWEFVEGFSSPFGMQRGTARVEQLVQFLESVREIAPMHPVTMQALGLAWERHRCLWHGDLVDRESAWSGTKVAT